MSEAFQHNSAVCVVVGSFAPSMFHPMWFERYGLLGTQEATAGAAPEKVLITEDISLFKVAGFDFDIRPDRVQIGTTQENLFGAVRDLVSSTLNILEANKITAVGLNWATHLNLGSEAAWHSAGHKMIPIDMWKGIWPKHVGMRNVTLELVRADELAGYVQVSVQPSRVLGHGMYIGINDHFDLGKGPVRYGADAAKLIDEKWESSSKMAQKMFEDLRKEGVGA